MDGKTNLKKLSCHMEILFNFHIYVDRSVESTVLISGSCLLAKNDTKLSCTMPAPALRYFPGRKGFQGSTNFSRLFPMFTPSG